MAGAGKKTFTAGETLTASDVNTYLMEQSVMVFGGTAARSSAIPTPSEGMTSYRTDTQQIESYDGSNWVGMSGLQFIKKQTIGSGVASVTVTGAFNATYDNYRIIITGGVSSADANLAMQMGATTSGYYASSAYIPGYGATSWGVDGDNNASQWSRIGRPASTLTTNVVDLLNPFNALKTSITFQGNGAFFVTGGGWLNNTTSYTEFKITPNVGTLTGGTIYVYGYGQ